jgi:hypothetical protein
MAARRGLLAHEEVGWRRVEIMFRKTAQLEYIRPAKEQIRHGRGCGYLM